MEICEIIKNLRAETGLSRKDFAESLGIPLRTIEDWEAGRRKPPEYIPRLLTCKVKLDMLHKNTENNHRISIVNDAEGNKIVMIHDLRFKGRRSVDWKIVEECLKEYIGKCAEITETSDMIYIGSDFPDEYAHSKDTFALKGPNRHAKANASSAIKELIEIATNKKFTDNYADKHKVDAKFGWYRYDTRFGIPVYNDDGEVERYNIFKARIIARHDQNGKLYLYDIIRIKKETSGPPQQ